MFKKILKDIDKTLTGSIAALLTIASGYIYWTIAPDKLVPFRYLVFTIFSCFLICIVFYAILHGRKEEVVYRLPRIISFLEDKSILIVFQFENSIQSSRRFAQTK